MALFMAFVICTSFAFVLGVSFGAGLMRLYLFKRELCRTQLDIAPAVARYRRSR